MFDFVGDAVGYFGQDVVGDPGPVGGHEVVGSDGADGKEVVVGAVVAHDAYGADAGEDAEELGHLALIAILDHFVPEHPIGLLENFDLFGGDLADDPHAQAGAGEGLTPDQLLGNAQLLTDAADLVLEEAGQGLDDVQELHILGHFDLVVVGLDLVGVALAGLDAVGVDGALGEESILAALAADLIPEDLIEFGADDLPLLLGVGHALQALQEVLLAVDPDKMHVKEAGKGLFNEIALVLAHEALVHKDAGQLVAHGAADQACGHGGIHAAGQAQNDLLPADALPQGLDGILNKGIHLPVAGAAADLIQEVLQYLVAELAVGHLGMGLDGIEPLRRVLHGRHGALFRAGGDLEARGQPVHTVRMAHPDGALLRHILEEQGVALGDGHIDLAVLGGLGGDDAAACHPGSQLAAVADAEDGNAQLQHLGIIMGRGHIIDAVGAAGKDDALVAPGLDLLRGNGVVLLDLRIHVQVTNPAGNQLIVLAAKIQDEDFFH